MKHRINMNIIFIGFLLIVLLGCSEDGPTSVDTKQNAADIQDFISKLNYNSEALLNYQKTNGQESEKDVLSDNADTVSTGNYTTICRTTKYNLKKNFDNVAILRPTNGIVWPGALVKGNESLLDGVPEPISIERAPVTISVNLPGMGENGIRTVKNPAASNIQAAIDSSLDWWNNNAYEEGYVNAANSSFRLTTSYSSKQLSLDVDLNAEWASGSVSSQFNYTSDEEKLVVMAVFKQAFYDVIFDTPTSPEKVFGEEATLSRVQNVINDAAAPAYIKSVTYGRIIMFRMETTNTFRSADVQAAFEYAAGYSVDGSLKATYDEILQESSIDLVTIGGNAAVATEPISSASSNSANTILEKVQGIISGENAVYSKSNPGVPIGYSVFYLKDNSLAKLGYTTEYTANECVASQDANTFKIYLGNFSVIKDCDGAEGAGEFYFKVQILDENNHVLANGFNKYLNVSDPYNYLINQTKTFTMPRTIGKKVVIKLICYESDKNIFGTTYYDSRMNGATASGIFSYKADGTWSSANPNNIEIGKGTDCNVKLHYSVTYE